MSNTVESARQAAEKTLNDLTGRLTSALTDDLLSIVLYGSAARGDRVEGSGDLNVIVVLREIDLRLLEKVSAINKDWEKAGNRALLFFSPWWITHSCDVFPLEFLDIIEARRVLHGEDPFARLEVSRDNLRLQCESEIKTRLIQLRTGYLECHDDAGRLARLLAASYSPMAALCRGILRIAGESPPQKAADAVTRVVQLCGLDPAPFREVAAMKLSGPQAAAIAPRALFQEYYKQIESLARAVDAGHLGGTGR